MKKTRTKAKNTSLVSIRSRQGELHIKLDDKVSFASLLVELKHRLEVSKSKALEGHGVITNLHCGQRRLNSKMRSQLEEAIATRENLVLSSIRANKEMFYYTSEEAVDPAELTKTNYQTKEDMAREIGVLQDLGDYDNNLDQPLASLNEEMSEFKELSEFKETSGFKEINEPVGNSQSVDGSDSMDGETHIVHGRVRSGQELSVNGNLLVVGDVNSGSIIRAQGDIYVMGKLHGEAHAGYGGNKAATIAAGSWGKVQIRIADQIAKVPSLVRNNPAGQLTFACIEDFCIIFRYS